MIKKYIQYGCGLSAPKEWINYDASPTLILQKLPLLGVLIKKKLNVVFPKNVKYGNIIKGLPENENTCDGLYCSHTLEHLSLHDLRKALKNSYFIMKKGSIFRCVLPDLEYEARKYISEIESGNKQSSSNFMSNTLLGKKIRLKGIKGLLSSVYGNSNHLWMWDYTSLSEELKNAGFTSIRKCSFNDSTDEMFKYVEDIARFKNALAIECKK